MRLFIGIGLPDEAKQRLATLAGGIPDARWVPRDNFHITLAFLGEVPDPDIADIGLSLGKIDYPAFDVNIQGVGIFGSAKRPRILWAGVEETGQLCRLQARIAQKLTDMNCPFDNRKFRPHVTLARVHNSAYGKIRNFLSDHALFSAGSVPVQDFSLFSSHSTGAGPEYREEMAFDLTP